MQTICSNTTFLDILWFPFSNILTKLYLYITMALIKEKRGVSERRWGGEREERESVCAFIFTLTSFLKLPQHFPKSQLFKKAFFRFLFIVLILARNKVCIGASPPWHFFMVYDSISIHLYIVYKRLHISMRVDLIGCRKPEIFTHLLSWEKRSFLTFALL